MPEGASELLERSRELATLGEALAAVCSTSHGRFVLVRGEAGIGKTALVRHFCAEHKGTARILAGACDALFTPRPLGPLLDIAEITGGELEQLVGSAARPHQVASALLRELGTRAPSVVVFEDMHWADEATLDVVRLIGRRVEAIPALVLASYRDEALEPADPLQIVLGELATGRAIDRVALSPLSRAAVARLAEPHGVDAGELYRMTAGNPFFVTEVLAAGEEQIPHGIRDAVLARVGRLSPVARTVVEGVSIAPLQAELRPSRCSAPRTCLRPVYIEPG
jgi:predicted ATPase